MKYLPARATGRVFSFGGGVQSVAVMVLQSQGKIRYDTYIFANVGNDSENPGTIEYLNRYVRPFAEQHGINLVEQQKLRFGKPDTLYKAIMRENRSIPIPAYMSSGAPGNRTCTTDYKIAVVDRWIKHQKYDRCVIGLGISTDEWTRAKDEHWHDHHKKKKFGFWKRREHPLLDLKLSRANCLSIIAGAGLPIPPKSSCYFCPFHRNSAWIDLKRDEPELFEKALQIENRINVKRGNIGKDRIYLHTACKPLAQAVGLQPRLFDDSACDGYCHT